MIASPGIDELAEMMAGRKFHQANDTETDSPFPYILFLGAGCARAAHVPTLEEIATRVLTLLEGESDSGVDIPPSPDWSNSDLLLKAFYKYLEAMSIGDVIRMLQSFFADIPVPLFYQDLALLIRSGYFRRILTTNFDTLLEQALNAAGWQAGWNYEVISLGANGQSHLKRSLNSTDAPEDPVKIIKLQGDLAHRQINLEPGEIEDALQLQGRLVKKALKGDIIMVGYDLEHEPINKWLSHSVRRELWWVGRNSYETANSISGWAETVRTIGGDVGGPDVFFSQLALRLLRLPALASLNKSFEDYITHPMAGLAANAPPLRTNYDDEALMVEDLRGKIRSSQSVLNSLESGAPPGERSPNIQSQIEYQKRQIIELEDKLRSLPGCRSALLVVINQLTESLTANPSAVTEEANSSDSTSVMLAAQFKMIKAELEQANPNGHVLSAALSALIVLAERLYLERGRKVVDPDLLQKLSSFAPSLTVW